MRPVSSQQARFVQLYIGGPDDLRGNGRRCYRIVYRDCASDEAASASASRLLRLGNVRAYMIELREAAAQTCGARLRHWLELAPDAQDTLRLAAAGLLLFPEADAKLRPELLRSAVRAASEILDRALGTTKQMHEHRVQGGIIVAVAGPPQVEVAHELGNGGPAGLLAPPDED